MSANQQEKKADESRKSVSDERAPLSEKDLSRDGLHSPFFRNTSFFKLHGNMSQSARSVAYSGFSAAVGRTVLVCTDVAARGLDLPDITDIIQYDMPCDVRDYIHRIGRTARLGRAGNAISMLLPSESGYAELLAKKNMVLERVDGMGLLKYLQDADLSLGQAGQKNSGGGARKKKKTVEDWATDAQMMFERFVMSNIEVFYAI